MPGPLELVVILVIALLILGPGKLPDVGAALGKSIREFRKAASDVQEAARVDPSPQSPAVPPAAAAPASQPPADTADTTAAAAPAAPTADSSSEPKP
jgi:TatA/E family protein of Tat protein translocase